MKIIELLDELEEITLTSSKVPLTGKIWLDANDITEIIDEIKEAIPEEMKKAQWINDQKDKLIAESQAEAEAIISNARIQADRLVETNVITDRARARAEEIIGNAELQSRNLKVKTYDYINNVMNSVMKRVDNANGYLDEMYDGMKSSFEKVSEMLQENVTEIENLSQKESQKGSLRDELDENFLPIEDAEE